MKALRGAILLTGREYYEVMEPWFDLTKAISDYLEELTAEVEPGAQLFLPQFGKWNVPENDLLDEEVEVIAGEAGFHIEANDDRSFTYYND